MIWRPYPPNTEAARIAALAPKCPADVCIALMGIAHRVHRYERALDEIAADAMEDATLAECMANVVPFRRVAR